MINVILCGGSGTRLWPMSRVMLPKQFVRLFDGKSLFQCTVERNSSLCSSSIIVSNQEQFFFALDQLSDIKAGGVKFLLEPIGKNTAPAVALACMALDPEEIVLVTSSDHIIKKQTEYEKAVAKAAELAADGSLVTFGIEPSYAEIGYGYIEAENDRVLNFKEKPELKVAEEYLHINSALHSQNKSHRYYWNSGMFCFKVSAFLAELEKYAPEILEACKKAFANLRNVQNTQLKISTEDMLAIPSDSIDYAVMEKSDNVKVVTCSIGWSDLGSFDSLHDELKRNDSKNTFLSLKNNAAEPVCLDSGNNLILTEGRQVALVDINDLLIVDTSDALLISKRGSAQKVKSVVEKIKEVSKELTEVHRMVHRPWGSYEVLLNAEQYKIKRVVVKPGRKLSLQKHSHRSEHWVVLSGLATVTVGEKRFCIRPNESIYIDVGEVHRLENEGEADLVIIEVQVGEYIGEDDIVRLDDIYGR